MVKQEKDLLDFANYIDKVCESDDECPNVSTHTEDDSDDDGPDYECEDYEYEDPASVFACPGGESALRAASDSNPRNLPCPTCGEPDLLTPKDVSCGYQCDECAECAEGRGGYE